jgi:uncharacterized ion transporter superfamily protein YfcC
MFLFQRSVTTFDYYLSILSTFFRIISLKKTVACLFTFFVFCGSYHVEAQMDKQEADSLKIELVKPKNSKAKNNIIYQILTNSYQPDSILHYSNMGIANTKNKTTALIRLAKWDEKVRQADFKSFRTIARTL